MNTRPNMPAAATPRRAIRMALAALGLLALPALACQPGAAAVVTPTPLAVPAPSPTAPKQELVEWRDVPTCDGQETLPGPVTFDWPVKIEVAADATWEQYRCRGTLAETVAFYRQASLKAPYLWQETGWTERPEGTVVTYYRETDQMWLFRWVVLDPSGTQFSRVVVARGLSDVIPEAP